MTGLNWERGYCNRLAADRRNRLSWVSCGGGRWTHHFGRADRERADRIPASSAIRREWTRGRLGSRHQNGPHGKNADRVPAKTDGLRDRVRGNWWGQPSSGNRAFDDYRAETLRSLEDEQREFKEFLKRLRVAKDRAEFDQFISDRHLDAPSASRRTI